MLLSWTIIGRAASIAFAAHRNRTQPIRRLYILVYVTNPPQHPAKWLHRTYELERILWMLFFYVMWSDVICELRLMGAGKGSRDVGEKVTLDAGRGLS